MESQIACQASGSGSGAGGAVVGTRADVSELRDECLDGSSESESSEDEGRGSTGRGSASSGTSSSGNRGGSSSGNGGGSSSGRGGSSPNGGRGSFGRGGGSGPSSSAASRFRLAAMVTAMVVLLIDQSKKFWESEFRFLATRKSFLILLHRPP